MKYIEWSVAERLGRNLCTVVTFILGRVNSPSARTYCGFIVRIKRQNILHFTLNFLQYSGSDSMRDEARDSDWEQGIALIACSRNT